MFISIKKRVLFIILVMMVLIVLFLSVVKVDKGKGNFLCFVVIFWTLVGEECY